MIEPWRTCLVALGCVVTLSGGLSSVVQAQRSKEPPPPEAQQSLPGAKSAPEADAGKGKAKKPKLRMPGASIPIDPAKRARLLKDLYAFLATAESADSAKMISDAIERVWSIDAGDTVRLMFDRAEKASAAKNNALALRMLDIVTRIAPDFPEAFNRRAFLHYQQNDVERALGDLRRAIALDPHHYKALDGLGQILREIGRKKEALAVYRQLQAVHPHATGAKSALDELTREAEGQGL